jgi:hypothetical protein
MVSPILHALGTMLIIAAGDLADPVGEIARHRRNCGRREAAAEQPQKVPAAALDRIAGASITTCQFLSCEMGLEANTSCHPHVLQR